MFVKFPESSVFLKIIYLIKPNKAEFLEGFLVFLETSFSGGSQLIHKTTISIRHQMSGWILFKQIPFKEPMLVKKWYCLNQVQRKGNVLWNFKVQLNQVWTKYDHQITIRSNEIKKGKSSLLTLSLFDWYKKPLV